MTIYVTTYYLVDTVIKIIIKTTVYLPPLEDLDSCYHWEFPDTLLRRDYVLASHVCIVHID